MSEGCLLWHSRYCGRDTTRALYKGPFTPSKKRASRLIRQALCINLGRIFAALSVRSWEIYRPSSSVPSWPLTAAALSSVLADSLDEPFGHRTLLARELIYTGAQVRTQLPSRISDIADLAELVEGVTVVLEDRR